MSLLFNAVYDVVNIEKKIAKFELTSNKVTLTAGPKLCQISRSRTSDISQANSTKVPLVSEKTKSWFELMYIRRNWEDLGRKREQIEL